MRLRATLLVQLLGLVAAVAVPLVGLEAWNLYTTAQSDSQRARQQAFHLAQVTASEIARFLGQAHNIADGLAARPAVRALDPSRCDPILKDFLGLAPRFANAVTLTMDGSVVCSGVPLAGPARGDPRRFLDLMRGPDQLTVGKGAPGVITGRWVVPVGRPLLDAQGRIAGAVVLPIDLVNLAVLPSVEGLPAGTVVALVDAEGTVLARSLEAERFVGTKAGAGRIAVREKTGSAEVIGIDGIPRIQGFTPVPGTDWIAVASLPAQAVYAPVRARIVRSAVLAGAILVLVLLLAWHLGRAIREPVFALADAANKVAAGNLAARAPVAGAAEIAQVATQFNRMLDSREHAEAELRIANQRYALAASTGDVWDWDIVANQLAFPQEYWHRLGYAEPETGNPFALFESILHPGDLAHWRQAVNDHIGRRLPYELDFRARTKSGEYRWFHTRGQAVWDESGRATYMAGTTFDITARKEAEARQQDLNARIAEILESMSDGFVALDREWRYTYVNARAAEMFGRSADSLLGRNYHAEYPEAAGTPFERAYRKAMEERVPVFVEDYYASWDRWFENRIYPAPDGISIFFSDITERKRAEAALHESEQRFRLAASTGDVWDADLRTGRGLIPAHFKQILGYEDHELENTYEALAALVHPEDRARWHQALADHFRRRLPYELEFRVRCKSGEYRWFATRGQATWDANGRATYIAGTSFDITDRKRAEAERRTALESFETIFLGAPEAMSISELETGRFLQVNDAFCKMFGYAREALIGQASLDLDLWSSPSRRDLVVGKVRAGEAVLAMEGQARTRSGELRDTLFSADRVDFGGTPCLLLMFSDISQRKAAEEALRESETRLRLAIEAADLHPWDWDIAADRIHWSRDPAGLLGAPAPGTEAYPDFRELVHPEDRERFLAAGRAALAGEAPYEVQFRISTTKGDERWLYARGVVERDAAGAPLRLRGVSLDVTARVRLEQLERSAHERLRRLIDNLFSFVGVLTPDGIVVEANQTALRAAGLRAEEILGKPVDETYWFTYSDESRARLRAAIARAAAGAPVRYDAVIRVAGGRLITIDFAIMPVRGADGRVVELIPSGVDITERKRAEDALRDANERLRMLSARLLEVQEAERAALARELHDEIGQSLTALKLGVQALARRVDAAAGESVAQLVSIADRTLAQTRSLSLDLRPPQLDQLGLAATLRDTLQRIADSAGIDARLVAEPEDIALERSVATAAFRVAQEALTNAVRHAAARHVVVELRATHDALHLAVSDDGKGFDLEAARGRAAAGTSMGLSSIEERVALAGGDLKIITRPGQGTRVQARFPLLPPPPAGEVLN